MNGKQGRKRGSNVVDTMAQAVAELGIELWKAKLAKKMGCQAFKRGSRVDPGELKQFIEDHPEQFQNPPSLTKEEADIKLKEVKIARETLALERDKGLLIRKAEVCERLKSIAQHQRAVLQRKLEAEVPPKLDHGPNHVVENGAIMRGVVDEICLIFHDRTKQWT